MKQFDKDSAIRNIKIKQNKNTYIKRLSISLSCLILVCIVILFTFAKLETSSEEYTLINGILNLDNCEFDKGKEWTFDYSGSIKTFDAPCDGKYKLEVWGAQGGTNSTYGNYRGGYGGYSVGTYSTLKDNRLYVVVGSGTNNCAWNTCGTGGGGSGYIGNASLVQNTSTNIINKMYCYGCSENGNLTTYTISTYGTTSHQDERDTVNCANGFSSSAISKCAKSGNGYAKITYLGKR